MSTSPLYYVPFVAEMSGSSYNVSDYVLLGTAVLILISVRVMRWLNIIGFVPRFKVISQPLWTAPWTIAVTTPHVGPYHTVCKSVEKLDQVLKEAGVDMDTVTRFGLYHDDPDAAGADKCRSTLGAGLHLPGGKLDDALKDKIVNNSASLPVKFETIPDAEMLQTTFPFKCSLSYMIGPIKVYPQLKKYFTGAGKEHCKNFSESSQSGIMEVYYPSKGYIEFLVPLSHCDRFAFGAQR